MALTFFGFQSVIMSIGKECAVIGYGSWATAIVKILTENGVKVFWHVLNEEVASSIQNDGYNCKYLRDVDLCTSLIEVDSDINRVVDSAEIVIVAMPSAFIKSVFAQLERSLSDKILFSAVKGIIPEDYITVNDYFVRYHAADAMRMGVVTGPSHAEEVGLDRLSYLTVVSPNEEVQKIMGSMIERDYIKVNYSCNVEAVEYAAVMKNIYALAVGLASGLGYGDNFISVLIANCAAEMGRFIEFYGAEQGDMYASACMGDLLVTCYSNYSRNRRLGLLIGRGCTVKSAMNEMTMVAEGYYAAKCIRHAAAHEQVAMPIADMVYEVLYENRSPRRRMRELTELLK